MISSISLKILKVD